MSLDREVHTSRFADWETQYWEVRAGDWVQRPRSEGGDWPVDSSRHVDWGDQPIPLPPARGMPPRSKW